MVRQLDWSVWISGASSGIGEAVARELGRRGCELALFARRAERLEQIREQIRSEASDAGASPRRVLVQAGDVRDRRRVGEAIAEADVELGGLDVVILNAGIGDTFDPARFDAAAVERLFAVNFLGVVYGLEAALPPMLERGRGRIACLSSIAGTRGMPTAAPYCASKAALSTFLESVRIDLRGRGVRISTISPGFVRTPLTDRNRFPMPWILPAEDAARRIVAGIRRGRREIRFPRRLTAPVRLLRLVPAGIWEWTMARLARRGDYHKAPAPRSVATDGAAGHSKEGSD